MTRACGKKLKKKNSLTPDRNRSDDVDTCRTLYPLSYWETAGGHSCRILITRSSRESGYSIRTSRKTMVTIVVLIGSKSRSDIFSPLFGETGLLPRQLVRVVRGSR